MFGLLGFVYFHREFHQLNAVSVYLKLAVKFANVLVECNGSTNLNPLPTPSHHGPRSDVSGRSFSPP
jgi:hypothetical protein